MLGFIFPSWAMHHTKLVLPLLLVMEDQHSIVSSYEDLVRRHVDGFLASAQQYAQITDLSKRVGEWEEKILPKLKLEVCMPPGIFYDSVKYHLCSLVYRVMIITYSSCVIGLCLLFWRFYNSLLTAWKNLLFCFEIEKRKRSHDHACTSWSHINIVT